MLDMGFIPDVEKIVGLLPATHQTLFFSATMAPEIRKLADAFLDNPKEITVSRPASVATTIVAGLVLVEDGDKRETLRRMIRSENVGNALIFCNRKRDVDVLYKSLQKHGLSAGALHGDMSQPERFATLNRFKSGELKLLVCSDVAARGLDIGGLSHVFNFDVPIHAEDYVHRIGRTGRAGLAGHAYTLATPDDRGFVDAIEKLVGGAIPQLTVEGIATPAWSEDGGRRRRGRGAKPAARGAEADKPRREKPARPAVDPDGPQPAARTHPPRAAAASLPRAASARPPIARPPAPPSALLPNALLPNACRGRPRTVRLASVRPGIWSCGSVSPGSVSPGSVSPGIVIGDATANAIAATTTWGRRFRVSATRSLPSCCCEPAASCPRWPSCNRLSEERAP